MDVFSEVQLCQGETINCSIKLFCKLYSRVNNNIGKKYHVDEACCVEHISSESAIANEEHGHKIIENHIYCSTSYQHLYLYSPEVCLANIP